MNWRKLDLRRNGTLRMIALVTLVSAICSCPSSIVAQTNVRANNVEVRWPTAEWETSTPEEQGMDSTALARLIDFGGKADLDSLLVTRHGTLVMEAYYAPYKKGLRHTLNSATKGVIGTLIGIGIQQGLLRDADQPVWDFFGDKTIVHADGMKKAVTLQHLLDMTSGLQWTEPLTSRSWESFTQMSRSPDWVQFILDRPMSGAPGSAFNYNSGNTHLLSAIITKKTGRSALEFAREHLFKPLGISDVRWGHDPQGISTGGAGLYLAPLDAAKIGYLYLRKGVWGGKQLLPEAWTERIERASVVMFPGGQIDHHYANLFWTLTASNAYMAVGFNSQIILVLPDSDIVAVTTGRGPPRFPQLIHGITASVKSEIVLPPDFAGHAMLIKRIADAAEEKPSPVGKTGAMANTISGKSYQLASNPLHLRSFVLHLTGDDPSLHLIFEASTPGVPAPRSTDPLGLDGRFRTGNPAGDQVFGTKGRWVDDNTFALSRMLLGDGRGGTIKLEFKFTDKKVEIRFEDMAGLKTELHGSVEG